MRPCLYLASPLGFTEPGRHYAEAVLHPALEKAGWDVLDPWDDQAGIVVRTLALPPGPDRIQALRAMSRAVSQRNRQLIERCDTMLALLDGPDVDSGTAAEIGWAAAQAIPVVGWRSDLRLSEHEAAPVNSQVEDFVLVSGGAMVTTLDEALVALDRVRPPAS